MVAPRQFNALLQLEAFWSSCLHHNLTSLHPKSNIRRRVRGSVCLQMRIHVQADLVLRGTLSDPSDKCRRQVAYPANVLLFSFLHIAIIHIAQFIFLYEFSFYALHAACKKPHKASDLFWRPLLAARTKRARAFTYKTSRKDMRPQGSSSD
jgi:hypothetical protein